MKILAAGDIHGSITHARYLLESARRVGCQGILQVGDFGYMPQRSTFHAQFSELASTADIDVFWLDGNHENFAALEQVVDVESDYPQKMLERLTYLPRGCTWTWDGLRFMALGGAYSADRAGRTEGVSWWPQELITDVQVQRAVGRGRVDIMFSHDAPEGVCPIVSSAYKDDAVSRENRLAVTSVVQAVQPRLLVHGHYHYRYASHFGDTFVEGLDCDGAGEDSWLVIDTERWG